jgi:hypothetical protein
VRVGVGALLTLSGSGSLTSSSDGVGLALTSASSVVIFQNGSFVSSVSGQIQVTGGKVG